MRRRKKTPAYSDAVSWIALNDDPGSDGARDLKELSGLISVLLVADLFEVDPTMVAADVIVYRDAVDRDLIATKPTNGRSA